MQAVIFIDVQDDFIYGALRNEKAIEVTPEIVEFAKDCVEKGYKLYATRDTHKKTVYSIHRDESDSDGRCDEVRDHAIDGYYATLEGNKLPIEHCIEGTKGWMIDDRLMSVLDGRCTFVNKPTFGSLDLAEIISEDATNRIQSACDGNTEGDGIDEIVLVGFCTSICVLANAVLLRAKFPNTPITVYQNLCACVSDDSHNAALKVLEMQQVDVREYKKEK